VDPRKPPERKKVFETIQKNLKLPLTGLREARNGLNAFTEYERDIEVLLTAKAKEQLLSIGLEAKLTPQVRANRSVICRQVDSYVGSHSKEEIRAEVERCNSHLKITEIIKFGQYTHVFKIEFVETEMANYAIQNGILSFNVKISPSQIQKEEYIDILMCFRCYKLETHSTNNCPTPDLVICSECSGSHDYRDCQATVKKCINCKGDHRTMAMSCPVKKECIKKKRQTNDEVKKNSQEKTYAKIVEKTIENVQLQRQHDTDDKIIREQGIRAFVMVIDAHMRNLIEPGTYSKNLNKTLKLNNIAEINVQENVDSDKLFRHNVLGKLLTDLLKKTAKAHSSSESESSIEGEEMEIIHDDTQEDEIIERHVEKMKSFDKSAEDIGVELFVKSENTKVKNLQGEEIKNLFKTKQLKYKITPNSKYNQDEIENIIDLGRLREDSCNINYVSTSEFNKIRNGLPRTPAKEDQKRIKTQKK
jgi:hypothetical protein